MRYKVKEADAESQISKRLETIDKTWERPVRCSTVLILSLGFGLIGLSVYTAFLLLSEYQEPKACISEECVQTAARILKAMDTAAAPCDDFYEFACGGWMRSNPVPEWSTNWDQLGRLREQLVTDLRELLREPDDPEVELPDSVKKAKALYRTCMDTDKLEAVGVEPIQSALRILGLPAGAPREGGPAPSPWHEVAGRARRMLGLSALLAVQVTEDVRNTSRNRIVIEQVTPGFSERYLLQSDRFAHEVEQYKKYIGSMVQKMDPDANSDEFADDIITFSKSLASIMTPAEVRRSGTHLFHEVSVTQLVQGASGGPDTWKKHDWKAYLELIFENTNVTLHPDKDRVIVMDLPYLQKLSVLLSNSTPVIVEKFLWWSVFSTVAPMTLSAFRDMGFTFSKEVFGLQQRTPRWKGCTANANSNFGLALSYLYVRRHFDQESRQKAIEMLEDVREAFAAAVRDLDWMDNTTRLKTLNKLRAIRNYVGFPAWLFTAEELNKHYKGAEVVEGNLFETYLQLTQAAVKKNLKSLREKPDRNRWVATPTTVNAFYSATLNSVTFPAGILQPPFYGNGLEAINYGSIGAIMGHEVTHGFDDQGRRYDENGNLKQWWSAATLEHYHTKVQCIIDQYNTYHMAQLPNITVHGFNTQGENIADNGGLRAALNAYSLYSNRNRQVRRDRLPGLPQYKPDQLFFLGFAQIWCGNQTVGALKSKLIEGVHSPNRIRVIGTLSNSKEFAEAWNCPAGSPMNPVHKCVLW